jgi:hypothetical protein
MPSTYHVHPEFGYFCPTPYRRRELLVAVVSILFGAMIGGSISTLGAAHDRNPDGVSAASRVDFSNSERVPVAAAEATPVAPTDADTKVEAKESIKPFPIRRVRARPAVHKLTQPGSGPHSGHTGRSSCVSLTAGGAFGERTSLGTASRFISHDEVRGGAAAFYCGQEAAKDRARSKPSPQ